MLLENDDAPSWFIKKWIHRYFFFFTVSVLPGLTIDACRSDSILVDARRKDKRTEERERVEANNKKNKERTKRKTVARKRDDGKSCGRKWPESGTPEWYHTFFRSTSPYRADNVRACKFQTGLRSWLHRLITVVDAYDLPERISLLRNRL